MALELQSLSIEEMENNAGVNYGLVAAGIGVGLVTLAVDLFLAPVSPAVTGFGSGVAGSLFVAGMLSN